MESFLRKIAIIFILCMLAVILIFLGINYQSNQDAKKLKNNVSSQAEKVKKNNNDKKDNKKSKTSEKSDNITKSSNSENSLKENNDSINNIDSYSDYNTNDYNSYYNSFIPVTKFSARINNNRLYRGDTASIITTIYPEDATVQEISYSSSNKNIAVVSKTGVVTAVNVGECYITISVKNAGSGQIKVNVLPSDNTTYQYKEKEKEKTTTNIESDNNNDSYSSNEVKESVIINESTNPSI